MIYKIILKVNLTKQDVCFVLRYKQTATIFYKSVEKLKIIMFRHSYFLPFAQNILEKFLIPEFS